MSTLYFCLRRLGSDEIDAQKSDMTRAKDFSAQKSQKLRNWTLFVPKIWGLVNSFQKENFINFASCPRSQAEIKPKTKQ